MPTLHWLTKDDDVKAAQKVPYRLLEEVPELGAGDPNAGNMLIQGDNLEALKALLPFYAGRVKCIYIDPPFNTGQAFTHYDDNLEHSIWLGMMYPRIELLRELFSEAGTISFHLDAEELAYCIIAFDEIFGRVNRVSICTFKQGAVVGHKAINPGLVTVTNYVVVYAKNKSSGWFSNKVFTGRKQDKRYASFISNFEASYSEWNLIPLSEGFSSKFGEKPRETKKRLDEDEYENQISQFVLDNANRVVQPVPPDYEGVGQETRNMIDASKLEPDKIFLQRRSGYSDIYMRNGKRWLFYKDKLKLVDGELVAGEPLSNLWDDMLSNNLHNEGGVDFPKGKKPEALVKRVFELFSAKDDLVLDSFLGSGTTAAVAQKMGRKYIGIEMGDHAVTHCQPRLKKVIEGEQGGISESVNWKGGGGFRFYRLGAPVFDPAGHISPDIRFSVLAAHIWFSEAGTPWTATKGTPVLGQHDGKAYALLYNGILGDKSISGGNVLTKATLAVICKKLRKFEGVLTIYGERSALGAASLKRENIVFKQTPYDVKARA
jgi:adenine-specific DNA-methyltransferase